MTVPLLVFDLDGTLVDTAPDLIATLNFVLAGEGLAPVPYGAARNMIGGGARAMLEQGLAAQGRICTPEKREQLYRRFLARYRDHIADRSRPFPGVETALDRLAGAGWHFAVCTNKLEALSTRLLAKLSLAERFAAICGQDTFGVQKPDADIVLKTIRRAGSVPGCAVMVGDSAIDIAAARAAGIPVIAVDFGYTEVPAAQLDADRVIDGYAKLPDALAELMSMRLELAAGAVARANGETYAR